ncbi:extensin-like [Triticum urartu]|uniref:extensin-like n=1 Tax=Triticum urartu TaxID=4572 RepID=UPI002044A447|nr:extensin-like [Triticum urartu]
MSCFPSGQVLAAEALRQAKRIVRLENENQPHRPTPLTTLSSPPSSPDPLHLPPPIHKSTCHTFPQPPHAATPAGQRPPRAADPPVAHPPPPPENATGRPRPTTSRSAARQTSRPAVVHHLTAPSPRRSPLSQRCCTPAPTTFPASAAPATPPPTRTKPAGSGRQPHCISPTSNSHIHIAALPWEWRLMDGAQGADPAVFAVRCSSVVRVQSTHLLHCIPSSGGLTVHIDSR